MASMGLNLAVAKLVEEMRKAGGPPTEEALNKLATRIAEAFKAKKDEVAILRLSSNGKMLGFLFPIKLAKIGYLPITMAHSLAIKTIRDRRGEIVNNFPVYKHPTVFESVDLSQQAKAAPIQKIVSAPMIADGKAVGVIQVSHKGIGGQSIGRDFTLTDLSELTSIGSILGKYLMTLPDQAPGKH